MNHALNPDKEAGVSLHMSRQDRTKRVMYCKGNFSGSHSPEAEIFNPH